MSRSKTRQMNVMLKLQGWPHFVWTHPDSCLFVALLPEIHLAVMTAADNGSLDKKDNTGVNTVLNTRANTGDNT